MENGLFRMDNFSSGNEVNDGNMILNSFGLQYHNHLWVSL